MFCAQTKAIMEKRVHSTDLNLHHTLFGGAIARDMDTIASITATKFCQQKTVTASFDRLDFISPIKEGEVITLTAFVSGVGTRSFEIYVEMTAHGECYQTQRLVAQAFMTFVLLKATPLPCIEPQSQKEIAICANYNERKKLCQKMRETYDKLSKN